jgi:acetylglutamate kinase
MPTPPNNNPTPTQPSPAQEEQFSRPSSEHLKRLQQKASTIVEALPYIQRFAGERVVVKFGGHAMRNVAIQESFARDVTLMRSIGIQVIVVHGGGPQIGELLKRLEIKSEFVGGMRVTDDATMEVVQMILMGQVNPQIVSAINRAGGRAVGLSGVDGSLLQGRRMRHPEGDLGRVGEVTRVDDTELRLLNHEGFIPVISPIAVNLEGAETLNVNADLAAGAVAEHTLARKLVLMTDVEGLKGPNGETVSSVTLSQAERWIEEGVISGGMIPKLQCAFEALRAGVEKVHILDGCVQHALLLELFTDRGVGTEVTLD